MSSSRPPPASLPPDSEPAPALSLPGELAFWSDDDTQPPPGPATGFSATSPKQAGAADAVDPRPAGIGHIGRYALEHQLGEGGQGTVYAAQDPLLSRLIAVKTLHVEVAESEREAFNALFLNEARAAAGLSHPHIVTVFDAGISDDRAYIAMELLKGRDLRQLREEGWRAAPAQAALIVRRVADALAYAHSKGVVHRDVKPANIFMVGRTQPKVLDFGIARITHRHDASHLDGDIAAGSPYYMAPEQVRQEPVDRRADVFSLGVVLYELLTDVKPFRGATLDDITRAVLHHEPPLAHTLDAGVPRGLALIAAKALAKDPEQRHRSASAFSRELRHWLAENTSGSGDGDSPAMARRTSPGWGRVAAAAVLIGVAAGALLWLVPIGRPADAPEATASAAPPPAASSEPASAAAVNEASLAPAPMASAAEAVAASAAAVVQASAIALTAEPPASATAGSAMAGSAAAPGIPASTAAPAKPAPAATKEPREAARDRRAREARERDAKLAFMPAAPLPKGVVHVAISPWGEVEVDGKGMGTSPPLTEFSLPEGRHQIVVRNADLPPFSAAVTVSSDQPVTLKHKF